MAASPTPPNADPAPRLAVALSGGRDSTALLHCAAHAARALGLHVHALHVHHGLHADAEQWLRHLRRQCARWARNGLPLTLHVRRLATGPAPGDSVEAWARRERYRALAEMAAGAGCGIVLLAQHRRDQAETLLLQALRGAGARGLAAMPAAAERGGVRWLRPWLQQPREAIDAYVARHRLRFVDDASNLDPRFARNRLRLQVWPALLTAFPGAEVSLAQAALRAQEAAACLRTIAAQDAATAIVDGALDRREWSKLGRDRRANLLRHWPANPILPDSLVQRLLDELPAARGAARWPVPGGELRLHREQLRWVAGDDEDNGASPAPSLLLDLHRPGIHALPGGHGSLLVRKVPSGGVAPNRLRGVRVASRRGGEQFQIGARGLPRSLKKQYQARGVPPWARNGPLLWAADGALLFVPGLGVDARVVAPAGSPQLGFVWRPPGAD